MSLKDKFMWIYWSLNSTKHDEKYLCFVSLVSIGNVFMIPSIIIDIGFVQCSHSSLGQYLKGKDLCHHEKLLDWKYSNFLNFTCLLSPTVMESIKLNSQYMKRSESTFMLISTTVLQKSLVTISVRDLLY